MADSVALKAREVYQGVEKVSAGYKMLAAMGWQEGDGLGANKQGMKTHIKAVKKWDSSGVGATEASRRAQDWTLGMTSFTDILGGLKEVKSTPDFSAYAESSSDGSGADDGDASSSGEEPSSEESGSDSDDAAPAAPPPAAASNKRKLAEAGEGAGEGPGSAKKGKLALHEGRYKKRELNKRVLGYSAADLAAILGQKSSEEAEEQVAARGKGPDAKTPKSTAAAAAAKLSRLARDAVVIAVQPREGDLTAWWRNMFHRAGIVGQDPQQRKGAEAAAKKKITIHGFSEADQTALYTRTQDNATSGRKGLGGSRSGKKADADWAGTKIRIGSDDEDSGDDEEAAAEAAAAEAAAADDEDADVDQGCDVLPGGVTIVWARGVRPAWFLDMHTDGGKARADAGDEEGGGTKKSRGKSKKGAEEAVVEAEPAKFSSKQRKACRKAAKKVLQEECGSLSLKKLRKRVTKAMVDDGEAAAGLSESVLRVLENDTAFRIQKGNVSLSV